MKILVFEDNLMWSSRLAKSASVLGHEVSVLARIPESLPAADTAIVNLGSRTIDPSELIPRLKVAGVYVIGHAGHKETALRDLGKNLDCDRIASNSELTFKLAHLLPTP